MNDAHHPHVYDRLRDVFLTDVGLPPEDSDEAPLDRIGAYVLLDEVGRGATGRVYRALHEKLMKEVAVKIVEGMDSPERVERLRREAATAAALRHPNVVAVHDVGEEAGRAFIVMDLVEGRPMREWLEHEATTEEAVGLLATVARAVGAAHRAGVLHRDLKPENVIVRDDDEPVVVDFGLARRLEADTLTLAGDALGTPAYMAPEQVRGDAAAIGPATDVHALGVMLFEAITGTTPFTAAIPAELYDAIRSHPAPRLHGPAGLADVVRRCLEKRPADRYADASALADDLDRWLDGEALHVPAPGLVTRGIRQMRRPLVAALMVAVLVGGLAFVAANRPPSGRPEPRSASYPAWAELSSALHGPLSRALDARYRTLDDAQRRRLVNDVDVHTARDDTGVGEAYSAWVRFLVLAPDSDARFEAAIRRHPHNPWPRWLSARRHLLRYAETARWPDSWMSLHAVTEPVHVADLEDEPHRRSMLDAACRELDRARECRDWDAAAASDAIGDLADAYRAYAAGDFEGAAQELRRLGDRAELSLEAGLILTRACFRMPDVDAAVRAASELHRRHPQLRPAIENLAECSRLRGMRRLSRNDFSTDDLDRGLELTSSLSHDPERDERVASFHRMIGEALQRSGRESRASFQKARAIYDAALDDGPRNPLLLANRAQCTLRLANLDRTRRRAALSSALSDLDEALELAPDHVGIRSARLGTRIEAVRMSLRSGGVDEETWAGVERDIESLRGRASADEHLFFEALYCFARGEALLRARNAAARTWYLRASAHLTRLLERSPALAEARRVDITARLLAADSDALPADGAAIVALAEEAETFAARHPDRVEMARFVPPFLDRTFRRLETRDAPSALAVGRARLDRWPSVDLPRHEALRRADLLARVARLDTASHSLRRQAVAAWAALVDTDRVTPAMLLRAARARFDLATMDPKPGGDMKAHLEEALDHLDDAVSIEEEVDALILRARVAAALGRPREAEADAARVRELAGPEDPRLRRLP